MTAPTLITPPAGGAMMAGLGVQAVVNEPIAISPARGTQGLRTGRDYVPVLQRRLGNPLTNMLIAGPVEAGCRLNYAIGSAGRVSQVVRQRSAKPPPRVRIPHSPPVLNTIYLRAWIDGAPSGAGPPSPTSRHCARFRTTTSGHLAPTVRNPRAQLAKRSGPRGLLDHEQLVTQPDIDVVAVTVKVPHHRALVSFACIERVATNRHGLRAAWPTPNLCLLDAVRGN